MCIKISIETYKRAHLLICACKEKHRLLKQISIEPVTQCIPYSAKAHILKSIIILFLFFKKVLSLNEFNNSLFQLMHMFGCQ